MGRKGIDGVKVILIFFFVLLVVAIGYLAVNVILVQRETKLIDQKMKNYSFPDANSSVESNPISEIDLRKGLNTKSSYSNLSTSVGNYGLNMKVNADNTVQLDIEWSKFRDTLTVVGITNLDPYPTSTERFVLDGFTKKVSSTFIGEVGQFAKGITLLFLMEDGTIEYKRVFVLDKDENGNSISVVNFIYTSSDGSSSKIVFKDSKVVNGVRDIVKLYNAEVGGSKVVLASRKDGSFYDITSYLNS